MYFVCVSIHVRPEFAERFVAAILDNARGTRKEPGNLRFDVVRREDDPNRFFLYEVYRDKEAFARHQETEHYARWRDAVTDWMAEPRVGLKYLPLFYGDSEVR
jgi:(4S)-4-hydroxy-5-phosphonooxypentane-2,3-dione isomerase